MARKYPRSGPAWIASGNIREFVNSHFEEVPHSKGDSAEKIAAIFREFMATPVLPNFIQTVDWPFCCGDFTRFIGDAGITYYGPYSDFQWWGYEDDLAIEHGIEGMMGGEDRVSLFECLTCDTSYWTCQNT